MTTSVDVGPFDVVLFDLDGTLYRGSAVIPGAAEAVARVRAAGKAVAFLTNNSSRTPLEIAAHLAATGIPAEAQEVETSALATASMLAGKGHRAFVVGENGIRQALTDAGIGIASQEELADVVVVGFDRGLDYAKLRRACQLIAGGARFVATNADTSFPAGDGTLWPGAGATVAAVSATTGVEPELVGKPSAPLFRAALARAGGGTPLVVGDRLDTDIAGAAALGWASMLVLTGVSRMTDLLPGAPEPTFVVVDLNPLAIS